MPLDSRTIIQEVRDALSYRDNALAGKATTAYGAIPAEQEIADAVMTTILPGLRAMFRELGDVQTTWLTPGNQIAAKIGAAAVAGETLAGFPADTWVTWGETLKALNTFLNTPISIQLPSGQVLETTPLNALITRYVPEVTA
jgi:hypothetical protein